MDSFSRHRDEKGKVDYWTLITPDPHEHTVRLLTSSKYTDASWIASRTSVGG